MLLLRSPQDAYRQVDFDARIAGADPQALVALCFEQFDAALGSALWGDSNGDAARISTALTRALAAITALQMGIDHAAPLAPALAQLYRAARAALLASVPVFDRAAITALRRDFAEIARAIA
ncbi:MAG: flagellar protein FliS [Novosphingobium sp.]